MSKHTPGPWWCHLADAPEPGKCDCSSVLSESQRGMGAIATVHHCEEGTHRDYADQYESKDTARANARLIAAAPDLLEAAGNLTNALKGQKLDSVTFDAALKLMGAVKKARGES